MISLTPTLARRLFITKQRLGGPRPAPDAAGLLQTIRDLRCVQLDPISAVDRSHRLVLFSRAGGFDQAELDRLTWQERCTFEYWAHCASIVLTEDYPIHHHLMRSYRGSGPAMSARTREWLKTNDKLRRHILRRIKRDGPLMSRDFSEDGLDPKAWVSTGWTSGRNVSRMLDILWIQGILMVAGRSGGQKVWDLAERCLPGWAPRQRLSEREVVRRAAEHSLRALGVATRAQIARHFIRSRYPGLPAALAELEKKGRIAQVQVAGDDGHWPGPWYVHADDLPLLERLAAGDWSPRTVLLSPFDNLICDRQRTRQLFDFDFTLEIYVPAAKRKYGYYVLPILHGDRLIGRVDPLMDRAAGRLLVNNVYAEPGAPEGREAGAAVAAAIQELAVFLGARDIVYERARLPAVWQRALRA